MADDEQQRGLLKTPTGRRNKGPAQQESPQFSPVLPTRTKSQKRILTPSVFLTVNGRRGLLRAKTNFTRPQSTCHCTRKCSSFRFVFDGTPHPMDLWYSSVLQTEEDKPRPWPDGS